MSWTDKQSIKVIKYIRKKYDVKEFVETGTFKGINAKLHSVNFPKVITCEKENNYYELASQRLRKIHNVEIIKDTSPNFLDNYSRDYLDNKRKDIPIFYLDAHFYDPKMPKGKGKYVVLKELKEIKMKSVIIIHDFDNNLGHINYDGIPLDLKLVKHKLKKIFNFNFYTNTLGSCDIVKPTYADILDAGLDVDEETLDNLEYAWRTPRLTYRGILYCLPTKLLKQEMVELGLREWN